MYIRNSVITFISVLLFITLPALACENNYFKDCKDCLSVIEESYDIDKISTVKYIVYKIYLTYNPYAVPVKYRCQLHKKFPCDLRSVKEFPEDYFSEPITMKGRFMGWKSQYGSPPVTRSDWLLESNGCYIYVTGGFPLGLHPMNENDIGKEITITGVLNKVNEDDEFIYYLEYNSFNSLKTILKEGN